MSASREVIAFLVFIAVVVLIWLQVFGNFGSLPKIILAVAIVIGLFALRYAKIRGAN